MDMTQVLRSPKRYFVIAIGFSLIVHIGLFLNVDWVNNFVSEPSQSVVIAKLINIKEIQKSEKSYSAHAGDTYEKQNSNVELGIDRGQSFRLPPSALLSYASFVNGNPNQIAQIDWVSLSDRYQIKVTIAVPFFGDYIFSSGGKVDRYGLAPDFYEEIRGNKGSRSVEFEREAQIIKFSVGNQTSHLPNGTQDRFSVLFQLASLVGGDPQLDASGTAREIPIAEMDKLNQWTFVSQGDEEVSDPTDTKKVKARHFVRLPRDAADKRKLEVWLSEEHHWLPLKILQTEPNGSVFELLLIKRQDT